ncbi:MAG: hypothetical protein ACR2H3_01610 [Acidimicrobiales bacterium]
MNIISRHTDAGNQVASADIRSCMLRGRRRAVAVSVVLVCGLFLLAGPVQPAGASCAAPLDVPDAIVQSDVVIVGTVTATRSRDRIATVNVEEVWKGDVGNAFQVAGGPAKDNAATSVDRTYAVGTRYLIFAIEPGAHSSRGTFGARYEDGNCSTTQTWSESLSAFRPASASVVTEPPPTSVLTRPGATSPGESRTAWWLLAAVFATATVAGAALVRARFQRRRQQTDSSDVA